MSAETAPVTRRCLVSGRVQGVYYRSATRQKALELGVEGRATNLPDGRVEVLASGPPAAVQALARWLWQGPAAARVEDVRCEDAPAQPFHGFETR